MKRKKLKKAIAVIYLALKDRRTAWYVKLFAALVVAYAVSPVDLIPDFIPVVGLLDDLILIPAAVFLLYRLIPTELKNEFSKRADSIILQKKCNIMSLVVILLWVLCVVMIGLYVKNTFVSV